MTVVKTQVNVPGEQEATEIARKLVLKELAAGTNIVESSSVYRWKGDTVEEPYFLLQLYTVPELKDEIIESVKSQHSDDTPVIEFHEVEGNSGFEEWVEENTS